MTYLSGNPAAVIMKGAKSIWDIANQAQTAAQYQSELEEQIATEQLTMYYNQFEQSSRQPQPETKNDTLKNTLVAAAALTGVLLLTQG